MPATPLERLVAAWGGIAEADRSLLGLVVVVLAALALTYLLIRLGKARAGRQQARRRRT